MYTTQKFPVSSRVIFVFNRVFIKNSEMNCVFGGEIEEKIHDK